MTDNVTIRTTKDNKLIIEVDLSKEYGKSGSGKSTIIASTGKHELHGHPNVFVGLNVYREKPKKK